MTEENNIFKRSSTWRLVFTKPARGDWNMAVDEALMESAIKQGSSPTLRLYAWDPPCVSLGYAQNYADMDQASLRKHGWTVVRRLTGGRAVLHTDEITYSVSGCLDYPLFAGSILESYRRLAAALVAATSLLGIHVDVQEKPNSNNRKKTSADAACFEAASNYEITFEGKKLIGSAQSRRNGGLLQHGTMPLTEGLDRIIEVIQFPSTEEREQAKRRLLDHAITFEEASNRRLGWQEAALAFQQGFRDALNIDFLEQGLSPEEEARVRELIQTKYGAEAWNRRL